MHRSLLNALAFVASCTSGMPGPNVPTEDAGWDGAVDASGAFDVGEGGGLEGERDASRDASRDGSADASADPSGDAESRDGAPGGPSSDGSVEAGAAMDASDGSAGSARAAHFHLLGTSGMQSGETLIETYRLDSAGSISRLGRVTAPTNVAVLDWSESLGQLFTAGRASVASLRAATGQELAPLDQAALELDDRATDLAVLGDGSWLLRAGERSLSIVRADGHGSLTPHASAELASTIVRRIAVHGSGREVYSTRCEERVIERRTFDDVSGTLGAPTALFRTSEQAGAPEGSTGVLDLALHPSGSWLLALSSDGKVSSFSLASPQTAEPRHSVIYTPTGLQSQFCSLLDRVAIHPTGRFVYATTDFGNAVAILSFDSATGRLALVGHLAHPEFRGASLLVAHPSALHLIVGDNAGRFNVFAIDPTSGLLTFVSAVESQIVQVLDLVQGRVEP